jgi:class 3 adenylate cyclase
METWRDGNSSDLTVLFTDIEGSTPLLEELGEGAWFDLLHRHNGIVRAHVAAVGGREIKTQGDGFMLAFTDAAAAVTCAAGVQRSLRHLRCPHTGAPVRVRIGGDAGLVRGDGNDVMGLHVHLASRIVEQAAPGEIVVSDAVRERVGDGIESATCRWGRSWVSPLRGVREPVELVSVDWAAPALLGAVALTTTG